MNTANKTKVGIIGVGVERGWANLAHVPVLKTLTRYDLTALSNRKKENAALLKATIGASHVYESAEELVQSPAVDLVVVSVRVPLHYDLIKKAIAGGKNVLSEWPLGRNLQEAEELAALAKAQSVKGYIGLQSRAVPAVRFIKDYMAQGHIGEVLSTSMIGSGIIYGETILQANDYTADPRNGAGMINVTFANAVDALTWVLGEFSTLSATTAIRRKTATKVETGETVSVGSADQVAVTGALQSGAIASVHFRGGHFPGTNFFWEINGTKGDIQIMAPGGSLAVFELTVKVSKGNGMETIEIPAAYNLVADKTLGQIPTNVGQIYQQILEGTAPTFDDAVIRHRMIAAIEESARTGTQQNYSTDI
jgi:predicted dehydrogenase